MEKRKVVRVIAPGFKPNDTVLANIESFFKTQPAFEFRYNKNIIQKHPLNSASQEARAQHLVEALNDEVNDIIWCLRGGYGSIQLLPYLDKIKKPKKKKLLIGLSDITSLHIYFYQKWGWSSLHASHVDRWVEGRINKAMLKENLNLMLSEKAHNEFKKIKPINQIAKKTNQLSGVLVGGNLITLTSHMGTPYELDLKNKFLFIEEIGERAYRIDRCLTQMHIAGKFKGCKGIFIGQMTQCLEPGGKDLLPWLWKSWGERLNIPIFKGIETGHDEIQRPLPLGSQAILKKMGDQFQLTVEYKA
jgi:muramoyltetrapeptide carboxypeptidase